MFGKRIRREVSMIFKGYSKAGVQGKRLPRVDVNKLPGNGRPYAPYSMERLNKFANEYICLSQSSNCVTTTWIKSIIFMQISLTFSKTPAIKKHLFFKYES